MQDGLHAIRLDAPDLRVSLQPGPGALQTLVDRVLALEQTKRDLGGAESAERFQREDQLRLGCDRGIGANEEKPENVVSDFLLRVARGDLGEIPLVALGPAQLVQHVVVRDPVEPRAGVVWQLRRPRLRCLEQRCLRGVFAELEARHAEPAREDGYETPEFPAKPVLRKLARRHVRTW